MMKEYLYTPFELAAIISAYELTVEEYTILLQDFHHYQNNCILPEYRQDRKKFLLAVMDKLELISDPHAYLSNRTDVAKDMDDIGLKDSTPINKKDLECFHLFFKELNIKIRYINKKRFARMKMRTLLSELGYKKRSSSVMEYITKCLYFYHIEVTIKGGLPCNLKECSLDETLIFRML